MAVVQGGDGQGIVEAGLHPATGGDGSLACSGDMLLEALVACAGVTLRAVATAIGVNLRGATCRRRRPRLPRHARRRERRAGRLPRHPLRFNLDTDAPDDQRATLIRLTERYCVVLQTLRQPPPVSVV